MFMCIVFEKGQCILIELSTRVHRGNVPYFAIKADFASAGPDSLMAQNGI